MKVVHVIGHVPEGKRMPINMNLEDGVRNIYRSGYWDIPLAEAQSAKGGMFYLHQRKNKPSYFGGRILEVEYYHYNKSPRSDRVVFVVESLREGKGQAWRGASYSRAWTGRVIDV